MIIPFQRGEGGINIEFAETSDGQQNTKKSWMENVCVKRERDRVSEREWESDRERERKRERERMNEKRKQQQKEEKKKEKERRGRRGEQNAKERATTTGLHHSEMADYPTFEAVSKWRR